MNYLIVTRYDISFAVSVLSQFLNFLCDDDHLNVVICILKVLLKQAYYIVIVIIVKLYVIQILIGQDFRLIEYLFLDIVFILVITLFLRKTKNNMLWQDLVLKQNIELWSQLLVSLFGLNIYLNNYNLQKSLKYM